MAFILPIPLLVSLTGKEIVVLYGGTAYLPAVPVLTVLVWGQIFHFAGIVHYHTMLAAGQQWLLPRVMLARTLAHVGLLIVLLPRFGLLGAACTVLITYSLAFGIYGIFKSTRNYVLDWLRSMIRPGKALFILAVFMIVLRPPGVVTWFGGLILYCLLLFLLSKTKLGEVRYVFRLLRVPN